MGEARHRSLPWHPQGGRGGGRNRPRTPYRERQPLRSSARLSHCVPLTIVQGMIRKMTDWHLNACATRHRSTRRRIPKPAMAAVLLLAVAPLRLAAPRFQWRLSATQELRRGHVPWLSRQTCCLISRLRTVLLPRTCRPSPEHTHLHSKGLSGRDQ